MIGIKFDPKKMFFDRPAVTRAVSDAARRVLSKFGAFVRQRAKTSIRKRKKSSPAGQPPSSHVGTLRKGILFGYDASQRSVVIGPTILDGHSGEALPALEHGGTTRVVRGRRGRVRVKTVRIEARPFMQPAFEHEKQASLPSMWRDSVKP
jgi:hypothetical protein